MAVLRWLRHAPAPTSLVVLRFDSSGRVQAAPTFELRFAVASSFRGAIVVKKGVGVNLAPLQFPSFGGYLAADMTPGYAGRDLEFEIKTR